MLIEGDAIPVLFVQLGHGVLGHMLRQGDGGKGLQIIGMSGLEVGANILKEGFGVITVTVCDKLDERVNENGPKQFREFEL